MSSYRGETEFIVTKSDMLNAVRYALECDISKVAIVDLLMKKIENEIETVLEDDCEEMTDEMWDAVRSFKSDPDRTSPCDDCQEFDCYGCSVRRNRHEDNRR